MNNPKNIENQVMVIFGASGDLAYRKLIPAIFDLYENKLLPTNFAVLGVSRSKISNPAFREKMKKGIKEFAHYKNSNDKVIDKFLCKLSYLSMDTGDGNEYGALKERLSEIDAEHGTEKNYVFYLSTPPQLYSKIPKFLYGQGLNLQRKGFRRIIIEKPFGHDLQSALDLNKELLDFFDDDQIYRIDHYLGKETVQNLMVTRFANGIYEPLWNRNFIQHIEVSAAESIGVEGRGGYYDEAGLIIKQARDLGIDVPILGADGFDAPELLELAGADALNDVYLDISSVEKGLINIDEMLDGPVCHTGFQRLN